MSSSHEVHLYFDYFSQTITGSLVSSERRPITWTYALSGITENDKTRLRVIAASPSAVETVVELCAIKVDSSGNPVPK